MVLHLFPSMSPLFKHHPPYATLFTLLLRSIKKKKRKIISVSSPCPSYAYSTPTSLFIPPSSNYPPISSPHLRHVDRAYLCSGKHSYACCHPPLLHPVLLPLICCPSLLSMLSSFLLFFPISSAQMRFCIQRRVCTFLITSSWAGIRWREIGLNWNRENCCANTHPPGFQVFLCVSMCVCVCMRIHCGGWLIKVILFLMVLLWPLSSLPVSLFILLLSVAIYLCSCLPHSVSLFVFLSVLSYPLPRFLLLPSERTNNLL